MLGGGGGLLTDNAQAPFVSFAEKKSRKKEKKLWLSWGKKAQTPDKPKKNGAAKKGKQMELKNKRNRARKKENKRNVYLCFEHQTLF